MNSKQRRKTKREFSHIIILRAIYEERYFYHDSKGANALAWCVSNIGYHRVSLHWDYAEFKFKYEKDAVMFALKWL